ncbi:MAG: hypothetical protein PUC66_05365 [Erysipelotrichaceae bacterium]|nr:hypothetical protein [Erysipelotrichaceae bacterium]
MPQWVYILIAVGIVVVLLAVFIISFIAYRRTPVPKGCEDVRPDPNFCPACQKASCPFFAEFHEEDSSKHKGEKQ